jgi:GAF domain-containing protein
VPSSDVHGDLAGLQQALLDTDSLEQFLHELAVLAARAVRDGLSCGVALRHRGRPSPVTACSDPLASEAGQLQLRGEAGPLPHVLRHPGPVLVPDTKAAGTAGSGQWPGLRRQLAGLGIRSCYALPLHTGGEAAGALVLYARQPGAFGPDETARAGQFTGHAAGALALAQRLASGADQNDQLRSSIVSRAVIDQALGVIMATERCPQDKAFAILRDVSQNTNVKLRDLAATVVTSVSGEPPRLTAPFEEG